jgi:solute carrier family 34 (sodium-dependent phosphate cotransporter)
MSPLRAGPEPGGSLKGLLKVALVVAAFLVFVFALETIKTSARGIAPYLGAFHVQGVLNLFGLGWIMAYVVLSGSPVAAVAVSLFGAGAIRDTETLGMIAGSRFGAAFVVLLVGTIHYLRGHRKIITVATGVLSLLVTWTIYTPATIGGYFLLVTGSLSSFRFEAPVAFKSFLGTTIDPLVEVLKSRLHPALLFVCGVAFLVGAFNLFDRALPDINPQQGRFRRIADIVYRPKVMFLLGIGVTLLTLSVSVSVGILVPLSAKGYIRRENVIPYIMGANISTFIDTLFASLLVGEPRAFSVVLAEMLSVSVVSLIVLLFLYRPYRSALEAVLESATQNQRSFLVFLGVTMALPLVFVFL